LTGWHLAFQERQALYIKMTSSRNLAVAVNGNRPTGYHAKKVFLHSVQAD